MTYLDAYAKEVASRKYKNEKGEYNTTALLAIALCHLPRHQELIRVLVVAMDKILNYKGDPMDEDEDGENAIVALASTALTQCEEIAADGLGLMGYEYELTGEDGNGHLKN